MNRRRFRTLAVVILVVLTVASSVAQQPDMQQRIAAAGRSPSRPANNRAPGMVPEQLASLKLTPGDLLSLNVLDDPDFSGDYRVDLSGEISIPELGSLHVQGESVTEARQQIAKILLDRGLMRNPQVQLNLLEYSTPQINVLGEVAAPGSFPLLLPESLERVIAMAGGPTMLAGNRIVITSKSKAGTPVEVHYSHDMSAEELKRYMVEPGDTVQVMRAGVVYVLGAVNRPGGYVMQEDGNLSLLQAVSIAGGTSLTASTGSVYVMRKHSDGSVVTLELPYKKMSRGRAADFELRVSDILLMPTSRFKVTFTSMQSVIASAASASIYAAAVY